MKIPYFVQSNPVDTIPSLMNIELKISTILDSLLTLAWMTSVDDRPLLYQSRENLKG